MIEKQMIRLMLNKKFYTQYKGILSPTVFFGDVSSFLRKEDFMLHKFLGYGTRSLKPIILNQNKNFGTQFLWSDALFIRNIMNVSKLNDEELIKSAVLSYIYKSPDLTYFYLMKFDEKNNSSFCNLFKEVN